ncbi:MAG: GNAT family N-acetyltransferase [Anaerolineae bacterium]|nr:GNAT family N-acetyltransferase [Anaerolineae bacterium]
MSQIIDLQHSGEQFLIYREEGQIAGAVSYLRLGDTLDICRLVVSPAYFRRGIAEKLLDAVEGGEPGIGQTTVSTAEKESAGGNFVPEVWLPSSPANRAGRRLGFG